MIEAFHLPALAEPACTSWEYGQGEGRLELRMAQLTPELLRRQVEALLDARERHLAGRPLDDVVRAVDRVAARLLDPGDELRRSAEEALPLVTGSSAAMVRHVLDRMAADWRRPRLEALLAAEFPDPAVLEGWVERRAASGGGGRVMAVGPRLTTHVFSGNIPGIAVTSLIRALLVRSAALGKTAVGDPVLPPLFARALAEEDPGIGRCVAVTYWPGGDEPLERVALESAEAVIVYGGDEALTSVRARTPPAARFLGYGQKLSFGVVAREALAQGAAGEIAAAAALEVATFDQHGCVSPHLFYVERGGAVTPERWAELVAESLSRLAADLPRGTLSPGESTAIRQLRGATEFAQISGSGVRLHASSGGTAWTVIFDPDPRFNASCLNRVVRVKPVDDLAEVAAHVASIRPFLQTVGLAGPAERTTPLATRLAIGGATRIAPIGQMAWPPPTWHHDGRPPLRDLVRWSEWDGPPPPDSQGGQGAGA